MAVGRGQVTEWLRSLGLDHYLQAFLDNGYDDLEMCRQIGHPDLDAIGVADCTARESILSAVRELLERASLSESLNPVYYTLENPRDRDYDEPPDPNDLSPPGCHGYNVGHGGQAFTYATAPRRARSRKTTPKSMYPPSPPPPRRESRGLGSGVGGGGVDNSTADSMQQRVRESATTCSLPVGKLSYCDDRQSSDSTHSDLSSRSRHTSASSGNGASRRLPGVAMEESFTMTGMGESSDSLSRFEDGQQDRGRKKASTIHRLFRPKAANPKSSSKHKYVPHQGDPSAQSITMSDDERILLMLQVKQGTITQEEAVEKVKKHTTARLLSSQAKSMSDISQPDHIHAKASKKSGKLYQKHDKQPLSRIKNFFSPKKRTKSTWYQETQSVGSKSPHPQSPHPLSPVPSPIDQEYQLPRPAGSRPEEHWQGSQIVHGGKSAQAGQEDLNSSGRSEHTTSSSLDSVHSYSVPSHSSSSSLEDPTHPRYICLARAKDDVTPNVFDKEALYLKKGDIIQVLDKHESGNWRGRLIKSGQMGYFKFVNVELIAEDEAGRVAPAKPLRKPPVTPEDSALVEGFLTNLQLTHLISVFHLNGYATLAQFKELTEDDLSLLDITHPDDLDKIRTAISCLQAGKGIFELDSMEDQRDSTATLCPSPTPELREKTRDSKYRSSKYSSMYRPSGVAESQGRQRKTMIPASRKIDSGFVSIATNSVISVESSRSRDSSSDSNVPTGNDAPLHRSLDFLNERQGILRDHGTLATSHISCDRESNRRTLTPPDGRLSKDKHKSEYSRDVTAKNNDQKRNTVVPFSKQFTKNRHRTEVGKESPHGSASKIPQIRSRTSSLDKSPAKSSPRNSRCRELVSESHDTYSSAPNSPLLQRNNGQSAKHTRKSNKPHGTPSHSPAHPRSSVHSRSSSSPSSRSESPDTASGLVTSHPHLFSGIKTAHIRSLGLTHVSRSTPSSPAAIHRISPATRSSVHAISRTSRQPAKYEARGVEARETDPVQWSNQREGSKSDQRNSSNVGKGESVTIATILKATGLSVYEPEFSRHGVVSAHHFIALTENDFRNLGVYNKDHIQTLVTWQRQLDFENGLNSDQDKRKSERVSDLRDKV